MFCGKAEFSRQVARPARCRSLQDDGKRAREVEAVDRVDEHLRLIVADVAADDANRVRILADRDEPGFPPAARLRERRACRQRCPAELHPKSLVVAVCRKDAEIFSDHLIAVRRKRVRRQCVRPKRLDARARSRRVRVSIE